MSEIGAMGFNKADIEARGFCKNCGNHIYRKFDRWYHHYNHNSRCVTTFAEPEDYFIEKCPEYIERYVKNPRGGWVRKEVIVKV